MVVRALKHLFADLERYGAAVRRADGDHLDVDGADRLADALLKEIQRRKPEILRALAPCPACQALAGRGVRVTLCSTCGHRGRLRARRRCADHAAPGSRLPLFCADCGVVPARPTPELLADLAACGWNDAEQLDALLDRAGTAIEFA